MLVHMNQESEGTSIDAVNLTSRLIDNSRILGTCHSGISLGSNGVLSIFQPNGGLSQVTGEWLLVGNAADFFVKATIVSGTLLVDPSDFGFQQLSTTRSYDNVSSALRVLKSTRVFFQIASDVDGDTIVDQATMTFNSFVRNKFDGPIE